MAGIEGLRQADLAVADIPAALALSDVVGWNQTAEDWAVFVTRGRTIGLFALEGLVATAATLPYGHDFGWISMVIVAPTWRRRGLALELMRQCIETLRRQGRAALLDATPAGAKVYERLGFTPLAALDRWEGDGGVVLPLPAPVDGSEVKMCADVEQLVAADHDAFGADRRFLLDDFLARKESVALTCRGGCLVSRPGHRAMQIGPMIASSLAVARSLLANAIAAARGRVFFDLFDRWSELGALVEAGGFTRQRPFVRMALDRTALPGRPQLLAIAAGPEFG